MSLRVIPIELEEANRTIHALHRHHKEVVGHRFSIGCVDDDGVVHGVCVVGRPVARLAGDPKEIIEVTRLCTDGTKNACSILYSAAARAAKEMGYKRIQTYILEDENGVSLKASGWIFEGITRGGKWKHTDGKPRRTDQPICKKGLWYKNLGQGRGEVVFPRKIFDTQLEIIYA